MVKNNMKAPLKKFQLEKLKEKRRRSRSKSEKLLSCLLVCGSK
jgi:hypothetical protein